MGGQDKTAGTEPATLHKVMRETIGFGLQKRYEPEKEIPHALMVLLMQMNENGKREQEWREQNAPETEADPPDTEH